MEKQIQFEIAGGNFSCPEEMIDAIPETEKKSLDSWEGEVVIDINNLKIVHLGYLIRSKRLIGWSYYKPKVMLIIRRLEK